MTVCRFFQQGYCKFGNSCKFEHIGGGGGGGQNSNRFGALGGGNGGNNAQFQRGLDKYFIKLDSIEADLTTETPTWILSAYAPGRDAPDQLFGGYPREQSFEEMRLHYMKGKAEGNEQKALAEAQELYQNAQAQMQTATRNVSEAAKYLLEGENRHPNRLDICREGTQGAPFGEFLVGKRPKSIAPGEPAAAANPFASNSNATPASSSPFGGGNNTNAAAPTTSAFGQPSALGAKPNPFGAPAFGQPAQPASGFGQPAQSTPSPFGQPSQPAASPFGQAAGAKPNPFGQPSQPAQSSPFGQPSQPATSPFGGQASQPTPSAFGQPSALGAKPSPFGAPAFGQTAQPGAASNQTSGFGQPSQLGQKPNPFGGNSNAGPSPFAAAGNNSGGDKPNPFGSGQPSQPASSPFGSQTSTQNNTGASPFGSQQPAQSNAGASPFGSQPASNNAGANPFGSQTPAQNTAQSNPFGQPSTTPASNPFASGGGNSTTPAGNPFATGGQASGAGAANPFAAAQANAAPPANPFGSTPAAPAKPAAPPGNPYPPGSSKQHPAAESYISKNMDGTLAAFKGKAVSYSEDKPGVRAFDGTWTRIWFPNGPPNYYKDTELPVSEYDDKTKAQWQQFEQTGTFADGVMPSLPPLRECTVWDF